MEALEAIGLQAEIPELPVDGMGTAAVETGDGVILVTVHEDAVEPLGDYEVTGSDTIDGISVMVVSRPTAGSTSYAFVCNGSIYEMQEADQAFPSGSLASLVADLYAEVECS